MASPPDDSVRTSPARLAALRRLGLLDRPASEQFDRLTRLAVQMLEVPAAFVSLVDEERDFYLSHCGFGEPLASTRELRGETFCHHVLRIDAPLVIPDTRAAPLYRQVPTVESLDVAAYAGVPVRLPDGTILGSFCVTDHRPRHWTEREIGFLREMAASVAAEIALSREVEERRRTEVLREAERGILEQISRGEPLEGVLDAVIRFLEQELKEVQCSVLLLRRESGTLHLGAAPHLPAAFSDAIEGAAAAEGMGACGTAAYRNRPVIIRDVGVDPLAGVFRGVAEAHGIRAAWSHPIRASDGSVLGTFALYGSRAREPDGHERDLVERAAHLAGVAVERRRKGEELRMRNRALSSIAEGVVITDARQPDNPIVHANAAFERITGYSAAEAFGRNGRYLQGPDTDPELAARLEGVFRTGQSFRGEILNYRKDVTAFWNLLSVTPVHDEAGRLSNFVVVQQDVTEQKRDRDELASRSRFPS